MVNSTFPHVFSHLYSCLEMTWWEESQFIPHMNHIQNNDIPKDWNILVIPLPPKVSPYSPVL